MQLITCPICGFQGDQREFACDEPEPFAAASIAPSLAPGREDALFLCNVGCGRWFPQHPDETVVRTSASLS